MLKFWNTGYANNPIRAGKWEAGIDIFAAEDVTILPGQVIRVPTGLHFGMELGEVGILKGKSGRAWDMTKDIPVGLMVLAGVIDCTYRDEVHVILTNVNWDSERSGGGNAIYIPKGKAVVQMVLLKDTFADLEEVFSRAALGSSDRTGGFGSTGL